jgi:Transposase zinc-binding domain
MHHAIDRHVNNNWMPTHSTHQCCRGTSNGMRESQKVSVVDGILAHCFMRVRCEGCAFERLVPFSCKGRGFCPSCGGRRMTEHAAQLVETVLPRVPVRQWVLTLPLSAAVSARLGPRADARRAGRLRAGAPGLLRPECPPPRPRPGPDREVDGRPALRVLPFILRSPARTKPRSATSVRFTVSTAPRGARA